MGTKKNKQWAWEEYGSGAIRITAYLGDESEVFVPEMIDGKPVTAIAIHAFSPLRKRLKENRVSTVYQYPTARSYCSISPVILLNPEGMSAQFIRF